MSDIYTEFIKITPKHAKELLELNINNRRLRSSVVTNLANAMKRGEWITTHQGIAISENGNILDGQYRLNAIIEADIPITMSVTYNLPNDSFKAIDCGLARNLEDRTKIPIREAEIVKNIHDMVISSDRNKISAEQALVIHNAFGERIREFMEYCPSMAKFFSISSLRAAAVILSYKDKYYAFNTYRNLVLGNIDELPESAKYFIKMALTGKLHFGGSVGARRGFIIGMTVYDRDKSDAKRISITENSMTEAREKARQIIGNHFN